MKAVICLALLAAVAVIGARGETCQSEADCGNEDCLPGFSVVCSSNICTCEDHTGAECTTDADCTAHCHNLHGHHFGHGHPYFHYLHGKCEHHHWQAAHATCHCRHL